MVKYLRFCILSVTLFTGYLFAAEPNKPIDPIAVPGQEFYRPEHKTEYKSLGEIEAIKYIRKDIPKAKTPQAIGKYNEELVPATCNLEDRAAMAINTYTTLACPKADSEIYIIPVFDMIPPRVQLRFGSGVCWPKFMEALPLLRIMSGSSQNLKVDQDWAKAMLSSIGPDGLYYLPLKGRPWDRIGAFADSMPADGGDFYNYLPTHCGRNLGVLSIYYMMTGDEIWNTTAKNMVDGLNRLAVWDGDKAGFAKNSYCPNEQRNNNDKLQIKNSSTENVELGWLGVGLAQYYRVSKYEPAKKLAYGLVNNTKTFFAPDGKWKGHFHCNSVQLQALAELAYAANDVELAKLVQKAYEWAKSSEMGSIPQLGYFPIAQKERSEEEPMELCDLGDMIAIATRLTMMGTGDYYEDIDMYARNSLIESQITHIGQVDDFIQKIRDGRAKGNIFWTPTPAKEVPLAYNESSDNFSKSLVGHFSSGIYPNDLHIFPWIDVCCTGNCTRAFYYAWENIVQYSNDELKVNLLMNRTSQWADINSFIPYEGKVQIKMKKSCRLKVRMNDWIQKDKIVCTVDNKNKDYKWDGKYIDIGNAKQNQIITFAFPIAERTEKVNTYKLGYTVTFKGNDAVDIEPKGVNYPLYQREYYRRSSAQYIQQKRFTCDNSIKW